MSTPLPGSEQHRFQRLEALFDLAVDTPPEERSRLLDPLRVDDETLVREVEDLLVAEREAAGLLSAGPWIEGDEGTPREEPNPADPEPLGPGTRLGPYRLERLLSQGGMGRVFLASRDDGLFEGEVAIKVLSTTRRRPQTVLRFCLERRILARLDHPHIARLLDAGTTAWGEPFLVMEHVDGLPIDEHCGHHRLGRRPRLRLFLQLCAAVSHAHQAGLVHRDLKPSNVMVSGVDPGEQRVKLLDFGIAKTLEPERFALDQAMTGDGERWMSLPWASPEQVAGERVDPRTDVYALGVLLFDLLTAASPYGLEAPTRRSLEDAILDGWRDGVDACKTQLGEDLRAIVLRAMAVHPEDRYPGVEALAQDVRRHLDHRPVEARRGGLLYRGGRLLRRHRITVGVVAVATTLAIGWTLDAVERHRLLVLERDRAVEVSETFIDLFEQPLASRELAPGLRAVDLLDVGLGRLEAGLDERSSAVRARLLAAYGSAYRGLQQPERTLELVERALAGSASSNLPQRTQLRLEVLKAQALLDLERSAEARPLARAALAEVRHSPSGDTLATKALLAMARAELVEHGATRAEPLFVELEEVLEAMPGHGLGLSDTQIDLAWLRFEHGDSEGASALLDAALAGRESLLGPAHPEIAVPLQHRGWMELVRGRPQEAERWLRRAWAVRRQALGESHPLSVSSLGLLTQGLERQWVDRYPELVELLTHQASLESEILGSDHPARAETLARLANIHWHLGEASLGLAAITEAQKILDDDDGFRRPMARIVAARIALDLEQPERAESLTLRAWRELPDDHPLRLAASALLARLRCRQGRVAEALDLLESATPKSSTSPTDEPWHTTLLAIERADCELTRGRKDVALELLVRTLPTIEAEKGPESRWTRRARALLAAAEEKGVPAPGGLGRAPVG